MIFNAHPVQSNFSYFIACITCQNDNRKWKGWLPTFPFYIRFSHGKRNSDFNLLLLLYICMTSKGWKLGMARSLVYAGLLFYFCCWAKFVLLKTYQGCMLCGVLESLGFYMKVIWMQFCQNWTGLCSNWVQQKTGTSSC